MVLELRMLGAPAATLDGVPVHLRGAKAWALLAYLLRSDRAAARHRLSALLFTDAEDPDGALRWNLSHLRRGLGVELGGDPVEVRLPPRTRLDLDVLGGGDAEEAIELPGLDEGLLAGIRVRGSDGFVSWLEAERRHLSKLVGDVRREAALMALGRGDTARAVTLAEQAAARDPLDEAAATLLVRCLHATARHEEARAVATEYARCMREDLGVDPSDAVWRALAPSPGGERLATGPIAVVAQLEAGKAAIAAGAIETGVSALRSGVVAARAVGNDRLLAKTLLSLGEAMIHGMRGVTDDAIALLHEALPLAETAGDPRLTAAIRRELGYVDFLRGRYERSWAWFGRAREISEDPVEIGWIDVYDAAGHDDVGDAVPASEGFGRAMDAARRAGDVRLEAYVHTMVGRQQLGSMALADAVTSLETALRLARGCDWTGLLPFPESMLADALRRMGQLARAHQHAHHAAVLADHLDDPCYQASSVRALSLVRIDRGDVAEGLELLIGVPDFCRCRPDTYQWMRAWSLDAVADVTTARGMADGRAWTEQLGELAGSCGMQPFLERSQLYRERGRADRGGRAARRPLELPG
jgi:DNA-binding SARP family transcriptional activator